MFKRLFSKKVSNVTKSIRVPEEMWNAIVKLSDEAGETPNSYMVLVLDEYLQGLVQAGLVKHPEKEASDVAS